MSRPDETISALLPVHAGVAPEHLEQALRSLLDQTRRADEIVVVEDGPLPAAHREVLDRLEASHPRVRRIRLTTNQGAGVANQTGLLAATGTLVAKVDADDICLPDRFERQLEEFGRDRLDLCGAAMAEFAEHPDRWLGIRSGPATQRAIERRMRINNPINHPTALYRREAALAVGGYPDMRFMQDYDLFARMLAAGSRMRNLPDVLVLFRMGDETAGRRRLSRTMQKCEVRLQRNLCSYGLIGYLGMARNLVLRTLFRSLPRPVFRFAHAMVFRRATSSRATSRSNGVQS